MFSRIATRYDTLNRVMSLGLDLRWRRNGIKRAMFLRGGRILDLGAGSGDVGIELLRNDPSVRVVSLDNCPELIDQGRRKMSTEVFKSDWIAGDGRFLPFSDESFDGLFAAFSLRNMADLPTVFAEMKRVLRQGGKLVILDMSEPDVPICRQIFKFQFKYIIPRLGKWFASDHDAYLYLLPSITNFYKTDELKDELINFGFKQVQIYKFMFHIVGLCIAMK